MAGRLKLEWAVGSRKPYRHFEGPRGASDFVLRGVGAFVCGVISKEGF